MPNTQIKNPEVYFASLTYQLSRLARFVSRCFLNNSPFFIPTITTLVLVFIVSYLNWCNSFLIVSSPSQIHSPQYYLEDLIVTRGEKVGGDG